MPRNHKILSPVKQKVGTSLYLNFVRFNAISASCLLENTLMLFALKAGMTDSMTAVMASFMYLCSPFVLLGKMFINRFGACKTFAAAWIARSIVAALLACLPFLFYQSTSLIPAILISVFFLFAFRSTGISANAPILGEITNTENCGRLTSKIFFNSNLFSLLTMAALVFVMKTSSSMLSFQGIILFGAVIGMVACSFLWNLPETESLKLSAGKPMKAVCSSLIRNPAWKKMMYATTASFSLLTLIAPFSMLALKIGYKLADYDAYTYIIVQIIGGLIAAFCNSYLADQSGPKPLQIIYTSGLFIVCLLWIFAPGEFYWWYILMLFFLLGFFGSGIFTANAHLFLATTPESELVGAGIINTIAGGLGAGIAGSCIGAALLELIRYFGYAGLQVYQIYFLIILLSVLPVILIIRRTEPLSEWSVSGVLNLLFSLRDLRALYALNNLQENSSIGEDVHSLGKLGNINSILSEKALLRYLHSPNLYVRMQALANLNQISLSPKGKAAVLHELREGEYTTATMAAEVLGNQECKEAIPLLRETLEAEDYYLRGKSMISLVLLQDEEFYPRIIEIFKAADNPRLLISGANASALIGDKALISLLLAKTLLPGLPSNVLYELLLAVSQICGCEDNFYQLIKSSHAGHATTAALLLDDFEQFCHEPRAGLQEVVNSLEKLSTNPSAGKELQQGLQLLFNTLTWQDSMSIKEFLQQQNEVELAPEILFCLCLIATRQCLARGL